MKKTILFLALVAVTGNLFAQKKTTTSATVAFDASTAIDALPKATNKAVVAALDTKAGTVAFEATVKNFAFSNPTIQDHFNGGNWMNSDKFPSFTFTGKILNPETVDYTKNGSYNVEVEGTLTVKDKSQALKTPATIVVKDGAISASTNFSIKLADFDIKGAPIDAGKVAKEPKITVNAEFK